jgi:DNA-binding NarL/FixJ family response regulator
LPDIEALPQATVDVAVIGAGVAGLSAALAAAQVGANVVVLEAGQAIGQGATGRNAGILSAGINMGLTDAPPGKDGADMWPATTREVLALVAQGRTDGGIGKQLFITPKTVEAHIRSIFGKLELPVDSSENRRVHAVLAFLQFKEGAPRPIQRR